MTKKSKKTISKKKVVIKPRKSKKKSSLNRKNRLKFYTKVVRISREEFKKRGIDIDYNKARKFVSQFIYSDYKNVSYSRTKISELRSKVNAAIDLYLTAAPIVPPSTFIDPRLISETDVDFIHWWDMNEFLSRTGYDSIYQLRALRDNEGKNLRFEVIADKDDRTGELTLLEYEGVESGVQAMIERIRENVNNDSEPHFEGYVGKREGRTDENNPDTYVLQFILVINGEKVVEPDSTVTLLPQREMTEEEYLEYQKQLRNKIIKADDVDRRKEEAAKAKKRKTAPRPTKKKKVKEEPEPTPEEPKAKKTRGDRVLELNEQKIKELEMLRKDLDDKVITPKEYKRDRLRIMKQYEEALKKMKKGGVV